MIKAVAKRKLGFINRETKETIELEPYAFVTLPDWVKADPMFAMATRAGILELHETISTPVAGIKPVDKVAPKKDKKAKNQ